MVVSLFGFGSGRIAVRDGDDGSKWSMNSLSIELFSNAHSQTFRPIILFMYLSLYFSLLVILGLNVFFFTYYLFFAAVYLVFDFSSLFSPSFTTYVVVVVVIVARIVLLLFIHFDTISAVDL